MSVTEITRFKMHDPKNLAGCIEISKLAQSHWTKLGAEYCAANVVHTGPYTGQLQFVVRYPNWTAYGRARDETATNKEFQQRFAKAMTLCSLEERYTATSVI
jgi:hypothetical protein